MSGGSYDYLYNQEIEWWRVDNDNLSRMVDRLAGLGYAEDAAREARELQLVIRQSRVRIESIQKRLSDVFQAIEWWDSDDSGEDYVKEMLAAYRGKP